MPTAEARWVLPPPMSAEQHAAAERLALALSVAPSTSSSGAEAEPFPPLLAEVLVRRDIDTFEAARAYFVPELAQAPDPLLMRGMAEALAAIQRCIASDKPILVYGDYDVDGTTAVALVSYWFTRWDVAHAWYVPDRAREGYGLSEQGVRYAAEIGAGLIIALDCGIAAHARAELARSLGIDLIVVDHHRPGATLPRATAIIDPQQPDCPYPFKELTGCGLANKLLMALAPTLGRRYDPLERADLVALSTCCDIVPLVGENRLWVYHGLEVLRTRPLRGLAALMAQAPARNGQPRRWTVSDLVFYLGPRLNAAGRLHHARAAVELLLGEADPEVLTADDSDAELAPTEGDDTRAAALHAANRARQELQALMVDTALELAEAAGGSARHSLVLAHPDWHPGIVGIVAAKLVEHYHRPTILLAPATDGSQGWKGSGRSVPGFDLYAALTATGGHLTQFGGHAHAVGLSLVDENVAAFAEAFEHWAGAHIAPERRQPELPLDAVARLPELRPKLVRLLHRMEPFGPGNLRPLFYVPSVLLERLRVVGAKHLKLELRHADSAVAVDAIAFDAVHQHEQLQAARQAGQPIDLAAYPDFNTFNGRTTLQLVVKALRVSA